MQVQRLRRGREKRVRAGHAWVFANELDGRVADLEPGGVVELQDHSGGFIGLGLCNPASLIAVRVLSRDRDADLDSVDWYRDRIAEAWAARQRVLPGRGSLRVVAGDADGLSGLVVDRYAPADGGPACLSVQITSLGMERRRDLLAQALQDVLQPGGAILRGDVGVRRYEGLDQQVEDWFGQVPDVVEILEGVGDRGVRFPVDLRGGQKTGFFLDQVANRDFAVDQDRVAGQRVLDAYAHTGAWALRALKAGAAGAVALDVSEKATDGIRAGAERNGVADRIDVRTGDARELLRGMARDGERFDQVFLDPPAFAKTRKKAIVALKAYREVNRLALALVEKGGLLYSSSCSHHVHEERFFEAVDRAGQDLGRRLRIVRRGEQGPDHPVHPAMPETRYLKHLVVQVGGRA